MSDKQVFNPPPTKSAVKPHIGEITVKVEVADLDNVKNLLNEASEKISEQQAEIDRLKTENDDLRRSADSHWQSSNSLLLRCKLAEDTNAELVEALERIASVDFGGNGWHMIAKQALAKARGQI
jgi:cell division septum initiation protein DivIVA